MRRVVVTGLGTVNPLGLNTSLSFQKLLEGGSGYILLIRVKPLENFVTEAEGLNEYSKNVVLAAVGKNFDYQKWKVNVAYFDHSSLPLVATLF